FTQGSGTMVTNIPTNSYALTSLDSGTQYEFYVRSNCSAFQNESDWAGPFSFTTIETSCPTGGVVLSSNNDLNNFGNNYPGCTTITGNMTIKITMSFLGWENPNYSPLNNISTIQGDLIIEGNSLYTSMNGLTNLAHIGGSLTIGYNQQLPDINGLSNLVSIGGNLNLGGSSIGSGTLQNLSGLNGLTTIGGSLNITSARQNLNGLGNLTTIGGNINVQPGGVGGGLGSFQGLNSLTSV